jgi:transcriptional/translational regulatory protein YebC/TACO1
MFDKKGWLAIRKSDADEETLMTAALEAGAEDIKEDDPENYEVITPPDALEEVKAALDEAGIPYENDEVTMLPQTYISLAGKEAEQMFRLMDALDDNDDVQKVYTNADIPEEVMAEMQ